MRILVVEDDDISREMLEQAITEFGYDVLTAADGAEAARVIQDQRLNLVISDWMMPEMNGIELCRWIRSQDFPWYLYVILLTARSETEDVIEGLSAGADEFLAKPFNPTELQIRIRTADRILSLETHPINPQLVDLGTEVRSTCSELLQSTEAAEDHIACLECAQRMAESVFASIKVARKEAYDSIPSSDRQSMTERYHAARMLHLKDLSSLLSWTVLRYWAGLKPSGSFLHRA